jgi:uncharacterized Zn-finger protein
MPGVNALWVSGPNNAMGFVGDKVVCPYCAKAFTSPSGVIQHVRKIHANAPVTFPPNNEIPVAFRSRCNGRNRTFLTKRDKSKHLESCKYCNPAYKKNRRPAGAGASSDAATAHHPSLEVRNCCPLSYPFFPKKQKNF